MEPLIKWVGGKRRLAGYISSKIGAHSEDGRFVELFAGSAALFFFREPPRAVLVDSCRPLMAFYEALQRDPDAFYDALEDLLKLPHDEATYYQVRERWNPNDYGITFAAQLMYLNRLCFNGLFRLNNNQKFNVPWGKKTSQPNFPSRVEIRRASELLQDTQLYTGDFSNILRSTHKDDVIYADPPYYNMYDKYTGGSFGADDHKRLSDGLFNAVNRGAHVFASNIDCQYVRDIYHWANIETIKVKHQVGASAESRKTVDEALIYSRAPYVDPKQVEMTI